ncbi:unnamed protein product [Bursaphelenchus okinawaensis]|uniref:Nuclear pore complex protein Nup85 n=1 Tax=Bursaphelenchus okinawaensis TaxID=465554 RepID=A0A811K6R2_9BILA|nr:unnamed protein product [Bursaphelenchus okinawaensis]CAG9094094.1 unnamed protein product [Bursaphelenchus okinawaensis]
MNTESGETFKYNVPHRAQTILKANSVNSTFLDSLLTRRLIYQFHRIFCETQEIAVEHGHMLPLDLTVEISARYRSLIREIIIKLKLKTDLRPEEKRLKLELESADTLWSLVESVYFQPKDSVIVKDLICWAEYLMGESAKDKVAHVLTADGAEAPDLHPSYVHALFYSIFQGDFYTVSKLLKNNSKYAKDLKLQQMNQYMELFIDAMESKEFSPSDFIDVQKKIREAVRSNAFADSELFQTIAGVLLGNLESYVQVTKYCFEAWYELLPAYILFSTPGCDLDNIATVAKVIYDALCTNSALSQVEKLNTQLDKLMFSILSKRCQEMLSEICRTSNFWWFPVHLCDLFQKHDPYTMNALADLISPNQVDENGDETEELNVRSQLVIDYGDSLLYSDYWNLAPDYLYHCGTEYPKQFLDEKVEKLTFSKFKKTDWFWNLTLRYDLEKTKQKICRTMVKRYNNEISLNESLCWALKSEDTDLIEEVSNVLLQHVTAETITNLRIFDAPVDTFYQYPILMLLQRFYQFRRCLLDGQAQEAATRLYELVRFGTAPIHFQLVLFDQMSKLLDPTSSEFLDLPQLNHDSIMDLMRAVNIFLAQNDIINPKKNADNDFDQVELTAKVGQLRHSLCNALALKLR